MADTAGTRKRIVLWGTGYVGTMVLAELADHPVFELVGVGVSNPEKVGRDAGSFYGGADTGILATDDVAVHAATTARVPSTLSGKSVIVLPLRSAFAARWITSVGANERNCLRPSPSILTSNN